MIALIAEIVAREFVAIDDEIAWLLGIFERKRAVERRIRSATI